MLILGRLSTHYLCLSRNSDATWLLLTLTLQLSRVVKDQLGLRIGDRNSKVGGEELRRA